MSRVGARSALATIGAGLLAACLALGAAAAVGGEACAPRAHAALGAAASASASASAKPRPKRRYVVAAMGDSLTDPRSFGGKYLKLLRKRCPKSRFDSYGVGGQI